MFTYHWDTKVFYILMGETVVDAFNRDEATFLLKRDRLITNHFFIDIEDGSASLTWLNDTQYRFSCDDTFIKSVRSFLVHSR